MEPSPEADYIGVAKLLLKEGARVDAKDIAGYSAAHHAPCYNSHVKFIDFADCSCSCGVWCRFLEGTHAIWADPTPIAEGVISGNLELISFTLGGARCRSARAYGSSRWFAGGCCSHDRFC
jgi:hypothetical protein